MVHDYGPGHQFASLHVELPAEQDPLEAHDLIDNIERDFLKNDRLLVTIHYDPIVTSDAAVGVLRARLTEKLRQLDPAFRCTICASCRAGPTPTCCSIWCCRQAMQGIR